jgi:hypothetical protein
MSKVLGYIVKYRLLLLLLLQSLTIGNQQWALPFGTTFSISGLTCGHCHLGGRNSQIHAYYLPKN